MKFKLLIILMLASMGAIAQTFQPFGTGQLQRQISGSDTTYRWVGSSVGNYLYGKSIAGYKKLFYTKAQADSAISAGGSVSSVFGRTGAITAQSGDYSSFFALKDGSNVIPGNNWNINSATSTLSANSTLWNFLPRTAGFLSSSEIGYVLVTNYNNSNSGYTNKTHLQQFVGIGDGSTIINNIQGNAATVTNGVYTTGSYANPSWLTSLAYSKITGAPDLSEYVTIGTPQTITGAKTFSALGTFNNNLVVSSAGATGILLNALADENSYVHYNENGTTKWSLGYLWATNKFEIANANGNQILFSDTDASAEFPSSVTASSLIKTGGTSSQFLKADGSVDGSTYLTTSSITSGNVTTALGYTPYNPATYPVNSGGETLQSVTTRGNTTNLAVKLNGVAAGSVDKLQFSGLYASNGDENNIAWDNGTSTVGKIRNQYNATTNTTDIIFSHLFNNIYTTSTSMIIKGNGSVGIGNTSPSAKLDVTGSIRASANDGNANTVVRNSDVPTLASGTYTPSVTFVNNVTAINLYSARYMRIGNQVQVTMYFNTLATTVSGGFQFKISLPITTNFTDVTADAVGNLAFAGLLGNAVVNASTSPNNLVSVGGQTSAGSSANGTITFTYTIK